MTTLEEQTQRLHTGSSMGPPPHHFGAFLGGGYAPPQPQRQQLQLYLRPHPGTQSHVQGFGPGWMGDQTFAYEQAHELLWEFQREKKTTLTMVTYFENRTRVAIASRLRTLRG